MHIAAIKGCIETVELLISSGSDVNADTDVSSYIMHILLLHIIDYQIVW